MPVWQGHGREGKAYDGRVAGSEKSGDAAERTSCHKDSHWTRRTHPEENEEGMDGSEKMRESRVQREIAKIYKCRQGSEDGGRESSR